MPFPFTKCQFCNYKTDVKCNLIRHQNAKHSKEICEKSSISENVQNVTPNLQNVTPNVQNVTPNVQNVTPNILSCSKCNKNYKTARHLDNHEKKCNKVDSLTCPRCMISFSNRHHKSRHIKADTCKARSIIHARTPNIQNITNIENQTINNINNQTNNNIIINNFGSERIDHISNIDINKMLIGGANTIPLYIEKKHFDKNFPENNNITFTNENKCKVLEDNIWKEKDLGIISSKLVHDNTEILLLYCEDNEVELSNCIENKDVLDHITDKLIIIYNKSDAKKYNEVLSKIKELVKNN
jgi:hypothetical protein